MRTVMVSRVAWLVTILILLLSAGFAWLVS